MLPSLIINIVELDKPSHLVKVDRPVLFSVAKISSTKPGELERVPGGLTLDVKFFYLI